MLLKPARKSWIPDFKPVGSLNCDWGWDCLIPCCCTPVNICTGATACWLACCPWILFTGVSLFCCPKSWVGIPFAFAISLYIDIIAYPSSVNGKPYWSKSSDGWPFNGLVPWIISALGKIPAIDCGGLKAWSFRCASSFPWPESTYNVPWLFFLVLNKVFVNAFIKALLFCDCAILFS